MRIGVALSPSHEPVSPAAWVAIDGEPGQFVDDVRTLPGNVVWLTNFPRSAAWRFGVHRHRHLRGDGYFATRLSELVSELGLSAARFGHPEAASLAARLCGRVVRRLHDEFGTSGEASSMTQAVSAALGLSPSDIPDAYYYLFRESAERTRITSATSHALAPGTGWLTGRRNRSQHGRELVGTKLPADSPWILERTRRTDRSDAWLETVDEPFFARCRVDAVEAALGPLSLNERSADGSVWLTDDEWRAYRAVALLDVESVLRGRWCTGMPGAVVAALNCELGPLSVTCGLVAEQVWTALSDRRAFAGEEQRFGAAGAWIRGRDRVGMLRTALALRSRNVVVAAYGSGSVQCLVGDNDREQVVDHLAEVGLQAPVGWSHHAQAMS